MVMNIDGLGEGSQKRAIAVRDRVARMRENTAMPKSRQLSECHPSHFFDLAGKCLV